MSRNSKVLIGVLGSALVVLVLLLTIFAGSGLFGSGSMMGQGDMMGAWSALGMGLMMLGVVLVPLLLLGALIAAIVLAVTQLGSGRHVASESRHAAGGAAVHEQSAEETLRQRFARGEIDAEEYEERRRVLIGESAAAHRANADGGSPGSPIRPMPPGE
jgi:putative membrane protein